MAIRLFFVFFLLSSWQTIVFSMTDVEYSQTVKAQDKFYSYLHSGDKFKKEGRYELALDCYTKAFEMAKGTSLEGVVRGDLQRIFEFMGKNQAALEQVNWSLSRLSPFETLYKEMAETKQRLLQKIEAQKQGRNIAGASSHAVAKPDQSAIRNIPDFTKASYGEQKQYMEENLPENTDILRLSKQAMLAEHSGNFKDAKGFYEQLLAQKEGVIAAQGEIAWAMLHCAVQRTSEVTGDESREKEMLLWIRDEMFSSSGQYHKYLSGLLSPVQDHLRKRFEHYQL